MPVRLCIAMLAAAVLVLAVLTSAASRSSISRSLRVSLQARSVVLVLAAALAAVGAAILRFGHPGDKGVDR